MSPQNVGTYRGPAEGRSREEAADRDEGLRREIEHLLAGLPTIPHASMRVTVVDGVVTLEGRTDWDFQRATLAELVGALPDVRRLVDRIVVPEAHEGAGAGGAVLAVRRSAPMRCP